VVFRGVRSGACEEPAVYAVNTWFVDDHLCEAHRLATEKQMAEEGLGEFLENAGFCSEFEIRPIQEPETCDYILPTATDWKPCGEKAKFAKCILDTTLACAEHAADMQRETDES
jgi:hypothetical protein